MVPPVAHAALSPHASTAPSARALDEVMPQKVQRTCQAGYMAAAGYELMSRSAVDWALDDAKPQPTASSARLREESS